MSDRNEPDQPVGGVSDADNAPPAESADPTPSASGDASYKTLTLWQKALAYARLLRLSNGPTAVADVWMGYAVVTGSLEPTWTLAAATAASLLAYHGGMAQNDTRDAEEDARDQRDRPLQRGYPRRATAGLLAWTLLCGSVGVALGAGRATATYCALLVLAVSLYNTRAKATFWGPLLMATCRYLNVLLGVAAASFGAEFIDRLEYAFKGLPLYVIGLTCFARMETGTDRTAGLFASLLLSLGGLSVVAQWPRLYLDVPESSVPAIVSTTNWYLLWAIVALIATRGMVAAILQPTPRNIGRGVGIAIQGLVVIDAVLAAVYAGPVAGLAILALLPVTMLLARWIPQT